MIIILKVILTLFFAFGIFVMINLYKDFKFNEKTDDYDQLTIAERIKVKLILYISLISIFSLCVFLLYFILVPIQLMWP